MKGIRLRMYSLLIMLIFVLTSCEITGLGISFGNGSGLYGERTDYLCSRIWTDEWYDDYGVYHYQEIRFYPDNTGVDYLYSRDRYGENESTLSFGWDWWNSSYTSVRLHYGKGRFLYMENMQMGGNQLNCILDGVQVYFTGK